MKVLDLGAILWRRRRNATLTSSAQRAALTLALAATVATEMRTGLTRKAVLGTEGGPLLSLVLGLVLALLLLDAAFDLWSMAWPFLSSEPPMVLNQAQMRLLKIKEGEAGFKLSSDSSGKKRHPNPFHPPLEGSFILPTSPSSPE